MTDKTTTDSSERAALLEFFGSDSDTFSGHSPRTVMQWRSRLIDFLQAARATPSTEPTATPFSQQRVAHLVGRLRDSSGGHINGPYDREAADMLEELAQLADSEGSRAVKYLRRARDAEARIAALEAAAVPPAHDVLTAIMRAAESAKESCGMDHESPAAIRNGKFATIAHMAAQGLGMVRGPAFEAAAVPTSAAVPPDDVLKALDLSPEQFRTEGGAINRAKLRAAIRRPADYLPPEHWLRAAAVPANLQWAEAPERTQWGGGMMEALLALGKDHTLRLYAEKEALHLVPAALGAPPGTAVPVEVVQRAWLVEWRFNGIQWLYLWPSAPGGFSFTSDASKALRFARREDAETALQWARDMDSRRGAGRAAGDLLVTEHEWPPLATLQAAGQTTSDDPHREHWTALAAAAERMRGQISDSMARTLCDAIDRLSSAIMAEPAEKKG